jgi:hypothetical protein
MLVSGEMTAQDKELQRIIAVFEMGVNDYAVILVYRISNPPANAVE